MRGIFAVIWAFVIFIVVLAVVGFCATLAFPHGGTPANIARIAGVVIALGAAINNYRRNSKSPSTPADKT